MLQGNGESTSSPKVNSRPTLPESMVKKDDDDNDEDEVVVVEIKSLSRNSTYYNNSHSSSVKLEHQPLIETVAEKIKQQVRELQKQRFSYASNVSYDSDSDDDSFRETAAISISESDSINSSNSLEVHDIESKTNQVPAQNEFTIKSVVAKNFFPHTPAKAVLPEDSMTRKSPKTKDDIEASNCMKGQKDFPISINSEQHKLVGLNFQSNPSPAILNACRSPSSLTEKTDLQFLDRPIQGSESDERAHLKIQIIDQKTDVDKHKLSKMASVMSGNVTVKTTVGTHVSDIFKSTQTSCEIKKQQHGVPVEENTDKFLKMKNSENKIIKKIQSTNSDNVIPNPNLSSVTKRMKSQSGALDNKIEFLKKRQLENCIQVEENNIPLDLCTNTTSSKVTEKRFDTVSVDEALHKNKHISYYNNSGARTANATISEVNSTCAKQLSSDNQISNSKVQKEFSHLSKDINISVRPTNNAENSLPFQDDKSLPPFLNSGKSASFCDNSIRNQTNKSIEVVSTGLIVTRVMSDISEDVTVTASNVRSISKMEKMTNNDIVAKPAEAGNQLEIGQSYSASGLDRSSTRVLDTKTLQKYVSLLCTDVCSNANSSTSKSKRSRAKKKSTIEKGSSKNECLTTKSSTVIIDSMDSVPTQQREKIPPPAYFSPSKLTLSSENNRSIQATEFPLIDSSPLTVTKNRILVPNSPAKDVVTSFRLTSYSGKQPSCAVSSDFNKLASCSTVSMSDSEKTPAHSSLGNIQVVPLSMLMYPASPSQKHSIKDSEHNSNKSPGRSSSTCTSKSYSEPSSPYFKSLKADISNSPSKQTGSITIEKLNNDEEDTSDIAIVYQVNKFHQVDLCTPEQNVNIHPLKDKKPNVSHIDSAANVQDIKTPQRRTSKSNTKTDFAASKCTEKSPSKAFVNISESSTNSICQQEDINAPSTSFKNNVEKTSTEKLASCSTVSINESEKTTAHSSLGNIQVVPLPVLMYPASPSQKHSIKDSEHNSNKSPGRSSSTCTSKSYSEPSSPYFKSLKADISNSPSKQTGSITIEKLNNDEKDTSDIAIVYQENKFHHVDLCIPEQNVNIHPLKDKKSDVSHIDSAANFQDLKTPQRRTGKSNTKTDFAASKCTEKSPSKAFVNNISESSTNSICQQEDISAPSTSFKNNVEKTSTESENLKLSYQISQHPNKFSVQKKLNSFEILMGRQKTPKKSPPKRLGKNSPIKFVNKNRTSPKILKYRTSPNKISPRKQLTFNVPDNLPAVQFTEPEIQKTDYVFYAEQCVTYFQSILDSLLEDKEMSGIIEKEAEVVKTFKNLDIQAKKLYIRMLGRKFTWHRVTDINYKDIDVKAAFNDLETSGLVTADYSSEELEVLLYMLKHTELKTLCKSFRISPVTLPKPQLIDSLLAYGRTQCTMSGFMSNNSSSILRERLRDNLNHCVKLNEEARHSFCRLIQVFSLPHQDLDDDREVSKQLLLMHYVKNKKVEYPSYDILKTVPIFSSRQEFISYEEANELFVKLTIAKESKNLDEVMKCGVEASLQLDIILSSKELSEKAVALPLFLRRYCSGTRYAYVMTSAIEVCRKKKELLSILENMLKMLLGQKIYLPHYRGRWYEQLILIEQLHLKDFTEAAKTIIEAMNDDHLNELQQHVISNRGCLLLSRRNGINDNKLKLKLKKSIKELPIDPPCYPINAKALSTAPGYKKVYVQQDDYAGEVTYSSVEEFAILNYKSRGYTEGIHAEGSIIVTLFGFIFWDLIYEYPVADVFRSCYQREPLDLHTGEFYENRKHVIDKRLEELCNWEIVHVRNHVYNILQSHEGKESIINWQRFRSLNQIVTVIECMSVRTLSKILERLIKNYQSVRKGFPDLLVWSPIKKQCKFVEVKGPNDRLSIAQKLWLNYLISCNSECAEVCKVQTTGSKMLKRRRSTALSSDDDFE